ncbi:hypothetical protein SDC9_209399 [bioreactor metagenome]|uniref:Uncharacterized protein n=1 Tax=bioreactor metagenome TaxID=1076179 RepID=A0A645JDC5_9ZZZZ
MASIVARNTSVSTTARAPLTNPAWAGAAAGAFSPWLGIGGVLVLAGAEDMFTVYYQQQLRALSAARSVEGRLFTAEEQAAHHCQIGNLSLALDTIFDWIER